MTYAVVDTSIFSERYGYALVAWCGTEESARKHADKLNAEQHTSKFGVELTEMFDTRD